jgi:hypothetical protein
MEQTIGRTQEKRIQKKIDSLPVLDEGIISTIKDGSANHFIEVFELALITRQYKSTLPHSDVAAVIGIDPSTGNIMYCQPTSLENFGKEVTVHVERNEFLDMSVGQIISYETLKKLK